MTYRAWHARVGLKSSTRIPSKSTVDAFGRKGAYSRSVSHFRWETGRCDPDPGCRPANANERIRQVHAWLGASLGIAHGRARQHCLAGVLAVAPAWWRSAFPRRRPLAAGAAVGSINWVARVWLAGASGRRGWSSDTAARRERRDRTADRERVGSLGWSPQPARSGRRRTVAGHHRTRWGGCMHRSRGRTWGRRPDPAPRRSGRLRQRSGSRARRSGRDDGSSADHAPVADPVRRSRRCRRSWRVCVGERGPVRCDGRSVPFQGSRPCPWPRSARDLRRRLGCRGNGPARAPCRHSPARLL